METNLKEHKAFSGGEHHSLCLSILKNWHTDYHMSVFIKSIKLSVSVTAPT